MRASASLVRAAPSSASVLEFQKYDDITVGP